MRRRSRLALTHTRLSQWRAQHGGRGIPVPEELWAEVVKVARVEGAGTTARALRLDRSRLEARMTMARGPEVGQASGGFVEIDACRLGPSFGFMDEMASVSRWSSAPGRRSIWPRSPTRSGGGEDDPDRPPDEALGGGGAGRLPPWDRWARAGVSGGASRRPILRNRVRVPQSRRDGDQASGV